MVYLLDSLDTCFYFFLKLFLFGYVFIYLPKHKIQTKTLGLYLKTSIVLCNVS